MDTAFLTLHTFSLQLYMLIFNIDLSQHSAALFFSLSLCLGFLLIHQLVAFHESFIQSGVIVVTL